MGRRNRFRFSFMASTLALDRPPVQKGQVLTYERLRTEYVAALDALPRGTQSALAEEFGISPGAISNARSNSGPRYSALQVRVLQRLSPKYQINDIGGFLVDYAESED